MSEIVYTKYFDPLGMKINFMSNGSFVAVMNVIGGSPELKTFDDAVKWLHTNTPTLEEFPDFLRELEASHDFLRGDSLHCYNFSDFARYVTKALTQINSSLKEICREKVENLVPDPSKEPQPT